MNHKKTAVYAESVLILPQNSAKVNPKAAILKHCIACNQYEYFVL